MKEWVRITNNEEIPMNIDGIDINEVFDDEEEDHKDKEQSIENELEDQTMWMLD